MQPLIFVVDRTRARTFEVIRDTFGDQVRIRLNECDALIDPEARLSDEELFSTTKTGSRFARIRHGSHVTSFDDHRAGHRRERMTRFARAIAVRLREDGTCFREEVVVCAGPRMMGALRESLAQQAPRALIREVCRHLASLTPAELAKELVRSGALSPASSSRAHTRHD